MSANESRRTCELEPGARSDEGTSAFGPRSPGALFAWLPDLAAVAVGAFGATVLHGGSARLCGAAAAVAIASVAMRVFDRHRSPTPRPATSVVACVPASMLLAVLVWASHSVRPESAVHPSTWAPEPAIHLAEAPREARDCLASGAAKAYMEALYQKLQSAWDMQETSGEGGHVVMGFVLDAQGRVRFSRVIDQSSSTYRVLAGEALSKASPFGDLTGELACLEQVELRATLDRTDSR
jgi:hypothetical protein